MFYGALGALALPWMTAFTLLPNAEVQFGFVPLVVSKGSG
jgi:hypothetical protein